MSAANSSAIKFPALSFGIEIELVFVFSERHLEQYLDRKRSGVSIVKTIPKDEEYKLRPKRYNSNKYHSWGLLNAGENAATFQPAIETPAGPIRAYIDEPLEMVSELLGSIVEHQIHNPANHSKCFDYSKWMVTSDDSIIALEASKKAQALKQFTNDPEDWDMYGIELVSPPFTSIEEAQKQVSNILDTLRGSANSEHGILLDESCGLHVHVGLPTNEAFPIKTLQHLAELQIIYEEQISSLHPAHRRNRDKEIESNRVNFRTECSEPVERTVKEGRELVTKLFEPLFQPFADVRRQIFDEVVASEDPLRKLRELVGDHKAHILNFTNHEGGPKTVEFRQHAASKDVQEIFWWVKFCLGMVTLAMGNADSGVMCSVKDWDDKIDIMDLLAAIGLEKGGVEYYRRKIGEYDDGSKLGVYFEEWEEGQVGEEW